MGDTVILPRGPCLYRAAIDKRIERQRFVYRVTYAEDASLDRVLSRFFGVGLYLYLPDGGLNSSLRRDSNFARAEKEGDCKNNKE